MGDREIKTALFDEFARAAKALASGRRIELVDVLANGERSVEALAREVGLSVANTSQHLQVLRQAGLVATPTGGHLGPLPAGRAGGVRVLAGPADPGHQSAS
jgi:DNA-binding transcriptional ArsR family regulator